MSASSYLRRLVWVACFTTLLLGLAVVSPLLVSRVLTGQPLEDRDALWMCLFLPTSADWALHVLGYILTGLLSVGLLVGANSLLRQWHRTRRMARSLIKFAQPANDYRWSALITTTQLRERVDVISVNKPIAFCYGLVRPRICVSTGVIEVLSRQEFEALLLHEKYHLLNRDPLKTLVARVLASTFFFLPLVSALEQQYSLAKEIEADKYVLLNQGSDRPLFGALYKLLQHAQAAPTRAGDLAIAGSMDSLNQRLDYLLNGQVPCSLHPSTLFVSSAVIGGIGAVVSLALWSAAASALWQQAHSGLGAC